MGPVPNSRKFASFNFSQNKNSVLVATLQNYKASSYDHIVSAWGSMLGILLQLSATLLIEFIKDRLHKCTKIDQEIWSTRTQQLEYGLYA